MQAILSKVLLETIPQLKFSLTMASLGHGRSFSHKKYGAGRSKELEVTTKIGMRRCAAPVSPRRCAVELRAPRPSFPTKKAARVTDRPFEMETTERLRIGGLWHSAQCALNQFLPL
jgi:hypothetical protein